MTLTNQQFIYLFIYVFPSVGWATGRTSGL